MQEKKSRNFHNNLVLKQLQKNSFCRLPLIAKRCARLRLTRFRKTKWLKGYVTIWIEHLAACHHPEKFSDHRHFDIGDSIFLIFHVTSCYHVHKWLCDVLLDWNFMKKLSDQTCLHKKISFDELLTNCYFLLLFVRTW